MVKQNNRHSKERFSVFYSLSQGLSSVFQYEIFKKLKHIFVTSSIMTSYFDILS